MFKLKLNEDILNSGSKKKQISQHQSIERKTFADTNLDITIVPIKQTNDAPANTFDTQHLNKNGSNKGSARLKSMFTNGKSNNFNYKFNNTPEVNMMGALTKLKDQHVSIQKLDSSIAPPSKNRTMSNDDIPETEELEKLFTKGKF